MKTLSLPNGPTGFFREDGTWQCTGSQMGRRNCIPDNYAGEKLRMQRLPFIDGCYDHWGAYWGSPANIWCAWGESETEQIYIFVRADSRGAAKAKVRESLPTARFFR